jgi:hypothetical protein
VGDTRMRVEDTETRGGGLALAQGQPGLLSPQFFLLLCLCCRAALAGCTFFGANIPG